MTYTLTILARAKRELSKINTPYFESISEKLLSLRDNPRPHGCKKLRGRDGWRIRVGDYRVIYEIDDSKQTVVVMNIGHRKDIYV